MTAYARCSSAACDGLTVACIGCGTVQCHGNGLARGSCSVCHYGILPGWSGWTARCSYAGCGARAAYHYVPGARHTVCLKHADRPRLTQYSEGQRGSVRVSLRDHVRTCVRYSWQCCGVVMGEHTPRPLCLSAADESELAELIQAARCAAGAS